MRFAIIGAGISGMVVADGLRSSGHEVVVFEKSRGIGGRLSTRRVDGFSFDHGGQYAAARDPQFRQFLEEAAVKGLAAVWPIFDPELIRYVGLPGMNGLVRSLGDGLNLQLGVQVTKVEKAKKGWNIVSSDQTFADFDGLVVTAPVEQAKALLSDRADFLDWARPAQIAPCWAVMVAFEKFLMTAKEVWQDWQSDLNWASRNNSKPGRDTVECWVLQSSHTFAQKNLEAEPDWVIDQLLKLFSEKVGPLPEILHRSAHRWRYARVLTTAQTDHFWDSNELVGACGDYGLGAGIESAFLSAKALLSSIKHGEKA